jgi:hypothetical protein
VAFAVSAPVGCEPLVALAPDQDPDALQAVALFDDQTRVEPLPLLTVLGLVDKDTVGAACATETVVDCVALPSAPVQVSVYVVFAVNGPTDWDPLVDLDPAQPPAAEQEVALADDQVRVVDAPFATELGLVLKLTVVTGFGVTVTVLDWTALPPLPVQVNTKFAVADSAPVDAEPLRPLAPDQAPEAAHALALVEDQLSVDALPVATLLGAALSATVGAAALTETAADWVALPPGPAQVKEYVDVAVSAPVD